ncbi:glycerophosphoryl diester phosphodiesterase [Persephonella hydrogeniphila]|uniref:Glycerophosphoryl diester phosphodiesterase n=1 Tax=Persephonella hydrogeniphila TaxID=198703 RepID=A0A285NM29_9AQUI|nr:glycerophosphodiester phosphodiesterase [Persephonella hydrogeniphila]SNZ10560.1 glycerophosphoryl diester phosphodiesterase [Persephonella hydrogeniphila]
MGIIERLSVKPFSVIGHRGAKGVKPENTVSAIQYGIDSGADIIEVDIRKTRDGKLILLHDKDFKRLTGRALSPSQLDFEFIRENITIEGEPVATLEEALDTVNGKAGLFIEIKEPDTTDNAVKMVKEKNAENWVAFISFYEEALQRVKEIDSSLKTGLIYMRPPGKIIEAKNINAEIVLPLYRLATEKAISFAHRLRLKVVSWVINDFETAKMMYHRKSDGIASDYPNEAVKWRERLKGG